MCFIKGCHKSPEKIEDFLKGKIQVTILTKDDSCWIWIETPCYSGFMCLFVNYLPNVFCLNQYDSRRRTRIHDPSSEAIRRGEGDHVLLLSSFTDNVYILIFQSNVWMLQCIALKMCTFSDTVHFWTQFNLFCIK